MCVVGARRGGDVDNRVTDSGVDYFFEEMKKVPERCVKELLVDEEGLSERSRLILKWATTGEEGLVEQIDTLKQKSEEELNRASSESQRPEKSCCVVISRVCYETGQIV